MKTFQRNCGLQQVVVAAAWTMLILLRRRGPSMLTRYAPARCCRSETCMECALRQDITADMRLKIARVVNAITALE